jgi:hypothetical protein
MMSSPRVKWSMLDDPVRVRHIEGMKVVVELA